MDSDASELKMLEEMGFTRNKALKALQMTGNKGLEPAMEWLLAHAEEMTEDEEKDPNVKTSGQGGAESKDSETDDTKEKVNTEKGDTEEMDDQTAKSLRCDDCGKIFSTQMEVEFHAAKSGHSNFSESTEEKRGLTEEEKEEQKRRLEERMRLKRAEREEKEKQEALVQEKLRIQSGKEIIATRRRLEEEEMKKLVEQRRREKLEEQQARQRVRDQIEQDKLARRQKFGTGTAVVEDPAPSRTEPAVASQPSRPKEYTQTRIQIRMTNGQALTQTFASKEQLSAVKLYVEMNRTDGDGPFKLMTNFPKKIFTEEDYEMPLDTLGLIPSAVLIVTKV